MKRRPRTFWGTAGDLRHPIHLTGKKLRERSGNLENGGRHRTSLLLS